MQRFIQLDIETYTELANRIFEAEIFLEMLFERDELQTVALSKSLFLIGKALESLNNARELIEPSTESVGNK
jgi:hypothetical protein